MGFVKYMENCHKYRTFKFHSSSIFYPTERSHAYKTFLSQFDFSIVTENYCCIEFFSVSKKYPSLRWNFTIFYRAIPSLYELFVPMEFVHLIEINMNP